MNAAPRVGLGDVAREWGRIGVVGFGGPPAHVALLRDLVVTRRGWLDAREFEDANAACNLLPGPASTQLAIYCAQRVRGLPGALLGGAAFILPGLVVILVLAAAALGGSPPRWLLGLAAGAGAAVVPVVVHAGLALGAATLSGLRGARRLRAAAYAAAGAAAAILVGPYVVAVLLVCGLVELVIRRPRRASPAAGLSVHAWPVAALVAVTGAAALPALAWTAFKVGALSYGGGFVIIPLMQGDAVETHRWMNDAQFLDAVAFGQLTPGPVTQTVAVVGYAAAGLGGALLAAAVAFAPSFLAVGLGGPRFDDLRSSAVARTFLDGAGSAATGAIVGAAAPLLTGLSEPWQVGVLVVAAVALALHRSPIIVLAGGAIAGVSAVLLGATVPG